MAKRQRFSLQKIFLPDAVWPAYSVDEFEGIIDWLEVDVITDHNSKQSLELLTVFRAHPVRHGGQVHIAAKHIDRFIKRVEAVDGKIEFRVDGSAAFARRLKGEARVTLNGVEIAEIKLRWLRGGDHDVAS